MYDDLNTPDDRTPPELGFEPRPKRVAPERTPSAPPPDREVPLPTGSTPSLLHEWLDGEVSLSVMQATPGGNDTVDLWNKIHDEAETLRSRTTPLYVHKRIMDALPADAYRLQRPWYRRPIPLNPTALIAGAAVLLGLGALLARAVFH
jgi:hypothetical protein